MRNFHLKALSLLIAALLWYFVTTNIRSLTLTIPVELSNFPPTKIITSQFVSQAQVKISGPSFLVSEVSSSPPVFHKEISPEARGAGRYVVRLGSEDLKLPPALQVLSIEPRQIELHFEDRITKSVPVELSKRGELGEGLTLAELSIEPTHIVAVGPKSEVGSLTLLETFPLDLNTATSDGILQVFLRNPGTITKLSHDYVGVRIKVARQTLKRRFNDIPIEIRTVNGRQYSVSPKTASVEIEGPNEIISPLGVPDVIPYARVVGTPETGIEAALAVDLPKGVRAVSLVPEKVTVSLENASGIVLHKNQGKK